MISLALRLQLWAMALLLGTLLVITLVIKINHKVTEEEKIGSALSSFANDLTYHLQRSSSKQFVLPETLLEDLKNLAIQIRQPEQNRVLQTWENHTQQSPFFSYQHNSSIRVIKKLPTPNAQENIFTTIDDAAGKLYYFHSNRFIDNDQPYILDLAMSAEEQQRFLTNKMILLSPYFLSAIFLFLLIQWIVLHRELRPLRDISRQLNKLAGSHEEKKLSNDYPRELKHIANSINNLLRQEYTLRKRYRQTLENLSHSLKDPLTIMKLALDLPSKEKLFHEQIPRMFAMIAYHLNRAKAVRQTYDDAIMVRPIVEQLVKAQTLIHGDKNVQCTIDIDDEATFAGNKGDLYNVLGNLIDNAYIWTQSTVTISSCLDSTAQEQKLVLSIADNGSGLSKEKIEQILDVSGHYDVNGYGVGLVQVNAIVDEYQGIMSISQNVDGGALFQVSFPVRKQQL